MILAAEDRKLEPVEVKEWGCTVHVKPLNGVERSKLVRAVQAGGVLYGAAMVASLCDENGNQLFTEADLDAINGKSGKVLERLSSFVVQLNGLNGGAVDDAKKD